MVRPSTIDIGLSGNPLLVSKDLSLAVKVFLKY